MIVVSRSLDSIKNCRKEMSGFLLVVYFLFDAFASRMHRHAQERKVEYDY